MFVFYNVAAGQLYVGGKRSGARRDDLHYGILVHCSGEAKVLGEGRGRVESKKLGEYAVRSYLIQVMTGPPNLQPSTPPTSLPPPLRLHRLMTGGGARVALRSILLNAMAGEEAGDRDRVLVRHDSVTSLEGVGLV